MNQIDDIVRGIFGGKPAGSVTASPQRGLYGEGVTRWKDTVDAAATEYGVDSDFVLGVMNQESRGREDALSPKGAMGPMQLMPATAQALEVDDPWDPEKNIRGGTKLLGMLVTKYGDKRKALAAYNWGEPGLDRAVEKYGDQWDQHLPDETRDYIEKIQNTTPLEVDFDSMIAGIYGIPMPEQQEPAVPAPVDISAAPAPAVVKPSPVASATPEITKDSLMFSTAPADQRGGTGMHRDIMEPPEMVAERYQATGQSESALESFLQQLESAATYRKDPEALTAGRFQANPVASAIGTGVGMVAPALVGGQAIIKSAQSIPQVTQLVAKYGKGGKAAFDALSRMSIAGGDYTARFHEDLTSKDEAVRNKAIAGLLATVAASGASVAPEILKSGWWQPVLQGITGGATNVAAQAVTGENPLTPEAAASTIFQTVLGGVFGLSMAKGAKAPVRNIRSQEGPVPAATIKPGPEDGGPVPEQALKPQEPAKISDEDIARNRALVERLKKESEGQTDRESLSEIDKNSEKINSWEKSSGKDYIWTEGLPIEESGYVKRGTPEETRYQSRLAATRDEEATLAASGEDRSPFGKSRQLARTEPGEQPAAAVERAAVPPEARGKPRADEAKLSLQAEQESLELEFLNRLSDEDITRLQDPTRSIDDIDFTAAPKGFREKVEFQREENARAMEDYSRDQAKELKGDRQSEFTIESINKNLGRWDGLSDSEKIVKAERILRNLSENDKATLGIERDWDTGLYNENDLVAKIEDFRSKQYSENSKANAERRRLAAAKKQQETPNIFRQEQPDDAPEMRQGQKEKVETPDQWPEPPPKPGEKRAAIMLNGEVYTGTSHAMAMEKAFKATPKPDPKSLVEGLFVQDGVVLNRDGTPYQTTMKGFEDTRKPYEIEQARIESERKAKQREEPLEGTMFDKNEMEARATKQEDMFSGEGKIVPFPKRGEGFLSQTGSIGGEEPVKVTVKRPGAIKAQEMFEKQLEDVKVALKKTLIEHYDNFMGKWVDLSFKVKRLLSKEIETNPEARVVVMSYDKINGASSKATMQFQDAVRGIFEGLPRKYDQLFGDFLQAKRTIEVEGLKTPEGVSRGIESTGKIKGRDHAEWLADIKESDPRGFAAMEAASKKYYKAFNEQLDQLVGEGLLKKEIADDLKANHQNYSPRKFIQHIDDVVGKDTKGIDVHDSGIMALKEGSDQAMINNPRYLLSEVVFRTQSRIAKNRANKAMLNYIRGKEDNALGAKEHKGQEAPAGYRLFSAFENGEKKNFILPRQVAKFWTSQDPQISEAAGKLLDWLSGGKILRPMATGYNPEFAIFNVLRDMVHSWFTTKEYSAFLPKAIGQQLVDMATVLPDVLKRQGRVRAYTKEGGGMEFLTHQGYVNRNRPWETPSVANEQLRQAQGILGYIGETSELLLRTAVRERAIKNGRSAEEATWIARKYIDFSLGGSLAKTVDRAVPYFNASIQGTRGIFRAFKEDPRTATLKAAQLMAMGSALAVANAQRDKEAWNQVSEREKESKFIILLPWKYTDERGIKRHSYIGLPKDQGQRIFATLGEIMTERHMGTVDGATAFKRARSALGDMVPIDPSNILPPSLSALLGYAYNKDFWRNEEFWKGPEVEAKDEYWQSTPKMYKDIGKATGLSPERLKGATGKVFVRNIYTDLVHSGWDEVTGAFSPEEREKLDKTALEQVTKTPGARRLVRVTSPRETEAAAAEIGKTVKRQRNRASLDMQDRAFTHVSKNKEKPGSSDYRLFFNAEKAKASEAGERIDRAAVKRAYDKAFASRFLDARERTIYKASSLAEREAIIEKTLDEQGLEGPERRAEKRRLINKRTLLKTGGTKER